MTYSNLKISRIFLLLRTKYLGVRNKILCVWEKRQQNLKAYSLNDDLPIFICHVAVNWFSSRNKTQKRGWKISDDARKGVLSNILSFKDIYTRRKSKCSSCADRLVWEPETCILTSLKSVPKEIFVRRYLLFRQTPWNFDYINIWFKYGKLKKKTGWH